MDSPTARPTLPARKRLVWSGTALVVALAFTLLILINGGLDGALL